MDSPCAGEWNYYFSGKSDSFLRSGRTAEDKKYRLMLLKYGQRLLDLDFERLNELGSDLDQQGKHMQKALIEEIELTHKRMDILTDEMIKAGQEKDLPSFALDALRFQCGVVSLTLSIDGYFCGMDKRRIEVSGSKVVLLKMPDEYSHYIYDRFDETKAERITLTKKSFQNALRSIRFEDWLPAYMNPFVMDGIGWSVEIVFMDGSQIRFEGMNAYPYTFDAIRKLFMMKD